MTRFTILAVAVLCAGSAVAGRPASAQGPASAAAGQPAAKPKPPPARAARELGRPHSFDLSVSVVGLGPSSLGSRSATLTPNQTGSPTPFTLFTTSARLQTAPGLEVRIGYAITRGIVVEGGASYSRPGVSLTVAEDAEDAAGFTSTAEHLSQYTLDVGVRFNLDNLSFRQKRGRPFAWAGAGYLRQLHEGRTLVETGAVIGVGGGVTYVVRARRLGLRPGLASPGIGIRADARLNLATGGYSISVDRRLYGSVGGGLFIGF